MIVVGVRVTRISTDGCAVRVQFVVGLHSVPYLFNSNFYQLTLRASNDRVLFFFALMQVRQQGCPARVLYKPGKGRAGEVAYEEAQTPMLCSRTVWLSGMTTRYDCAVRLRRVAAVLACCIVPGTLSTVVIHSVENLHACDFVE